MKLRHSAFPNYVAAWNMHTKTWSVKFAPNLMNARTHRKVIEMLALDRS